jgi:hypothetical protein
VNGVFEQIDGDRDGRISVADFLVGFNQNAQRVPPIAPDAPGGSLLEQKRGGAVRLRRPPEDNFVSVGGDSALNLFQALDGNNTGYASETLIYCSLHNSTGHFVSTVTVVGEKIAYIRREGNECLKL